MKHIKTADCMTRAYYSNLYDLLMFGQVSPDGGREFLYGHTFMIEDASRNYVEDENPGINNDLEYLEAFWNFMMDPESDTTELCKLNPKAKNFLTEYNGRNTAYGPRIHQQLSHVLNELRDDPHSRRASIMILEGADQELATAKRVEGAKIEYPCTMGMQYFQRGGFLHAHCVMRSNCYVSVIHVDVYVQTMLQKLIAEALGLVVGPYIHTALNAHILGKDMDRAKAILEHRHAPIKR